MLSIILLVKKYIKYIKKYNILENEINIQLRLQFHPTLKIKLQRFFYL